MDIKQLHYFIQVAETGSLTRAAARLGLTQPALSWQIGKLEAELSVSLFSRNGRGVSLTDAGAMFLRRAKALAEDADRAKREMQALRGTPMGLVTVGFPPAIGAILAMPLVQRVNCQCPEVKLQIVEGYSGYVHEWLLGGRVDIGILYDAARTPSLSSQPLINERLYLMEAAEGAGDGDACVEFCRLGEVPLILPSRPHAIRRLIDQFSAQHDLVLNIRMEVTAFPAIKDLLINGHGATILPVAPLLSEVQSGRIRAREIIKPSLSQVVGLATSPHQPTLATQAVARLIREVARELVANGRWPERLPERVPHRVPEPRALAQRSRRSGIKRTYI